MKSKKETEEFYTRLKSELDLSTTWPSVYLFKFIVPSDKENINQVEKAFDCMGAVIKTTKSKTGKYTSISVDVLMKNSQEIVDKYIELSIIKDIISL
jgi:hypothetical protein